MTLPFLHETETATVLNNPDPKSSEMGFCTGAQFTMIRNRMNENMIIVAVGATRFVITRPIARKIMINPVDRIARSAEKESSLSKNKWYQILGL